MNRRRRLENTSETISLAEYVASAREKLLGGVNSLDEVGRNVDTSGQLDAAPGGTTDSTSEADPSQSANDGGFSFQDAGSPVTEAQALSTSSGAEKQSHVSEATPDSMLTTGSLVKTRTLPPDGTKPSCVHKRSQAVSGVLGTSTADVPDWPNSGGTANGANPSAPRLTGANANKAHEIMDADDAIHSVRGVLLKLNRMKSINYLVLKRSFSKIFEKLHRLSNTEHSKLNIKNQISSPLLNAFLTVLKCPILNDQKIHELYKLLINCYVINFQRFTKKDKLQYNLLFQFILDLIFLHNRVGRSKGQSFMNRIENHKMKNQLTLIDDTLDVNILLHYLIQLLFLVLESGKSTGPELKQFVNEKLVKVQAFLILNRNVDVLRLFCKYRAEFKSLKKS